MKSENQLEFPFHYIDFEKENSIYILKDLRLLYSVAVTDSKVIAYTHKPKYENGIWVSTGGYMRCITLNGRLPKMHPAQSLMIRDNF